MTPSFLSQRETEPGLARIRPTRIVIRGAGFLWLALVPGGAASATELNSGAAPLGVSSAAAPVAVSGTIRGWERKTARATRAQGEIVVDGRGDEELWLAAEPITDFVQSFPKRGAKPSVATEVRILYDAGSIYVLADCRQDPTTVRSQLSRRDRSPVAEWVQVNLDGHHDRRSAFRFSVFVSGTLRDAAITDDGSGFDYEWDGVWEAETRVTDTGWTAEIRIPLHQLRFPAGEQNVFGLQIRRYVVETNETIVWVYQPPEMTGEVSRFGDLEGLAGLKPGLHVEALPYARARAGFPRGLRLGGTSDRSAAAGLDLKWGVTNSATLDVTANPDFGQVELDQVVLNLSRFETYLSEKRPFFLEGRGQFAFPFEVFYSRRIGRAPSWPALDPGETPISLPDAATILGAAKLTGRTAGGTAFGILGARTDEERAVLLDATGERSERLAAQPLTCGVGRFGREFRGGSKIGAIVTALDERDGRRATVGGLDTTLLFLDRSITFSASGVRSRAGSQGAAPADGYGWKASLDRTGGVHWSGGISAEARSRDLALNDLGYLSRSGLRSANAWLNYDERNAKRLQYAWAGLGLSRDEDLAGRPIGQAVNFYSGASLRNNSGFNAGLGSTLGAYDDLEVGPNYLIWRPAGQWIWASAYTDMRRRVSASLWVNMEASTTGQSEDAQLSLKLRPSASVELTAGTSVTRSRGRYRWTYLWTDATPAQESRPIMGELTLQQASATLTALLALTPHLTIQASGQLFLASIDTGALRFQADARTLVELEPSDAAWASGPAYTTSAVQGSAVLRWEWRPGSTFFLVYTRSQPRFDAGGRLAIGPDARALLREAPNEVLLAKLTFWFGT